ncbi:hypothetical protein [Frankia sp. AgB32]|uniref:hypothetical protein n=1 Tax=Frankia sp. AgB32 TaxID=631119 RepID=UPI00200E8F8C|nr:hypothetical protein [Frankia sp. AgB32]MCK9895427.1 hypothetical protein [Frankia sp. AgB32]
MPTDLPESTPLLADLVSLEWVQIPERIVLRNPAELPLRLVNRSDHTLAITRDKRPYLTLRSVDGTQTSTSGGGIRTSGITLELRTGESADVTVSDHPGHDGAGTGHPSRGRYLLVAVLHLAVQQKDGWKYDGGVIVTPTVPVELRVFPDDSPGDQKDR